MYDKKLLELLTDVCKVKMEVTQYKAENELLKSENAFLRRCLEKRIELLVDGIPYGSKTTGREPE